MRVRNGYTVGAHLVVWRTGAPMLEFPNCCDHALEPPEFWEDADKASWPRCVHTDRFMARVRGFPFAVFLKRGCRVVIIQESELLRSRSFDPFYVEDQIIRHIDAHREERFLVEAFHAL